MRAGWREVRLGELVSIKHGWPFKSEFFSEELSGRPIVVGIGNFEYTGGFRFETTTLKEYRDAYPPEYELRPGDILLIMTCQTAGGEILGIPGRIPNDGRLYLHNQRLGKVVVRGGALVDAHFLYYLFLSRPFNRHLYQGASGTKILHTSPGRIEDFKFNLPPLAEQQALAEVLDALDSRIELSHSINRTLEAVTQGLFQSWFVDYDPVRAKAERRPPEHLDAGTAAIFPSRFRESEVGRIPEGWRVAGLDQIAQFLNGLALQKYPARQGEPSLPVVKIAQLRAGSTEGSDRANTDVSPEYIVDDGDLLFSWSGSLLVRIWTGGRGALNQHLFKVNSSSFPRWFVRGWLGVHLPEFQAIAAGKATTMGHIQRHHLTDAKVVVPPSELLTQVGSGLASIEELTVQNEVQNRTLAALRDLLLPKLLSGELHVKDAEAAVAASA